MRLQISEVKTERAGRLLTRKSLGMSLLTLQVSVQEGSCVMYLVLVFLFFFFFKLAQIAEKRPENKEDV